MNLGRNCRKTTWIEDTHFGNTVPWGSKIGHNIEEGNQLICVALNTVTTF